MSHFPFGNLRGSTRMALKCLVILHAMRETANVFTPCVFKQLSHITSNSHNKFSVHKERGGGLVSGSERGAKQDDET